MAAKSEKLLQRMRRAKANWKSRDLSDMLLGHGFQLRHGGNHDVFTHPDLPGEQLALPRHRTVMNVYITKAIKFIDKLDG